MGSVQPLFVLAACSFLISGLAIARPKPPAYVSQPSRPAVNDVQLLLLPNHLADTRPGERVFTLEFRNISERDVTFRPGTLRRCGGQRGETDAVRLNLVDSNGQKHRHLEFLGDGPPYSGGCAGQTTPYVVTLPPGASLLLSLDLGKYFDWSDSKQYEMDRLPPGTYSLQAELVDADAAIVSNSMKLLLPNEVGVPLGDNPHP
jgi:hypothetical protein